MKPDIAQPNQTTYHLFTSSMKSTLCARCTLFLMDSNTLCSFHFPATYSLSCTNTYCQFFLTYAVISSHQRIPQHIRLQIFKKLKQERIFNEVRDQNVHFQLLKNSKCIFHKTEIKYKHLHNCLIKTFLKINLISFPKKKKKFNQSKPSQNRMCPFPAIKKHLCITH